MTKATMDFTGVRVIDITEKLRDDLDKRLEFNSEDWKTINDRSFIKKHDLYPNMGLVLKSKSKLRSSLLARTSRDNTQIWPLDDNIPLIGKFKPKNKEQIILYHLLNDHKIKLHIIVGKAGSGKTFITSAYALNCLDLHTNSTTRFQQVILTKPMHTVGSIKLGAVPGDISEKFDPYLVNFKTTFERICGTGGMQLPKMLELQGMIKYMPIQLMRGASFANTLVIVDEAQNLNYHETKTVGTRLGEGSALIFLGDLTQRDTKLQKTQTGLYHLMHNNLIKNSPMASGIELIKNERSELSNLIDEAFKDSSDA